jgi:hypothetical protein
MDRPGELREKYNGRAFVSLFGRNWLLTWLRETRANRGIKLEKWRKQYARSQSPQTIAYFNRREPSFLGGVPAREVTAAIL